MDNATNGSEGISLALFHGKQGHAEHRHRSPSNKEDIMGEFTSGFFMGDQTTNGRVLVVDDEADVRKVVRMTLQKAGYDVLEAENGEKAIETINSGSVKPGRFTLCARRWGFLLAPWIIVRISGRSCRSW